MLRTAIRVGVNREAVVTSGAEYFRLAGVYLHEHEWEGREEQEIWRLHSEGETVHDIEKVLDVSCRRAFAVITEHRDRMLRREGREGRDGRPRIHTGRSAMMESREPGEILQDALALLDQDLQAMRQSLERREQPTLTYDEVRSIAEISHILIQAEKAKRRAPGPAPEMTPEQVEELREALVERNLLPRRKRR